MSKKSKFNNQANEIPKENEFQEKADEEEELEEEENNNKNNPEPLKPKINQDPFDISDDEDEVQDKISDLNSVPNFFEIPKPSGGFKPPLSPSGDNNPLLKKYEPLDWHKAFPINFNISDNTILYTLTESKVLI